ncbi:MAG TPA: hypothetical protein VEW46_13955 [Pyrinomonadaceae bacterium]|nr:hypothetical protein [Pyrinomonadaceae bacterium]
MQVHFAKANIIWFLRTLGLLACLSGAGLAQAQSSDIAIPSPVRSNEVTGTISARDIGDPRLTDHYYAFTGTPGDVLITIDSRNLNGDVDVFTSSGLRPLLKITVYSSNSSPITKSIYLRKREDLILRVEARTPNDDEGTYRLSFGGSFEPITSGPLLAEARPAGEEPISPAPARKGRRVSSVGARIDEPAAPEVAAAPTPEPPAESTAPSSTPVETTEAKPAESREEARVVPPRAPRVTRGRRGATRRTRTTPAPRVEEPATNTETPSRVEEPAAPSTPAARRSTKRGGNARRNADPETSVETTAETGPRLIIETNDGTLINRYMSSVRRVTVENGQVVVVAKDGKIERIALASVLRMSIAP